MLENSTVLDKKLRIHVHDFAGHPFPIDLSREFARVGHQVTHSYCADYIGGRGNFSEKQENTLRIRPISLGRAFNKYSILARTKYEIGFGYRLLKTFKAEKCDVIIISNLPLISSLILRPIFKKYKIIYWHQDIYHLGMRAELQKRFGKFGGLVSIFFESIEKKNIELAFTAVPISEAFLSQYQKWKISSEKIFVIPNWAPLKDIYPTSRDNNWTRKYNIPSDKLRLLYSGTLGRKHNPRLLLELVEQLQSRGLQPHLTVISSGDGVEELRKAANENSNIRFMEFAPIAEMPDVLSSADLAVVLLEDNASEFSIPSKVLSYFAAGCCVVGLMPAANEASRQIFKVGGFVAPSNSEGVIALAKWIFDQNLSFDRIAHRSHEFAISNFAVTFKAAQFLKTIDH
jgi:glycosyltransferase involved in cell wall biosynthesis